ncbi:hypothetical protein L0F63_000185 [Massospora cicadina]|nr:hypothetical protein L0F63_000185 [Massospora cicadina]
MEWVLHEIDSIPRLEDKKAFTKKWIGAFLNSVVLGDVVKSQPMLFAPRTGLPISVSHFKLSIRQQLLCKFVALLMDRACLTLNEFEAMVPKDHQYMALVVAVALANVQTAASYGGTRDLSKEGSENLLPLQAPRQEDLVFATKRLHERPETFYRLWALRTLRKPHVPEISLGDTNLHFKRLADVFLERSIHPETFPAEAFCEITADLAEYTFFIDEFLPTRTITAACLKGRAKLTQPCAVDWARIEGLAKVCSAVPLATGANGKNLSDIALKQVERGKSFSELVDYLRQHTRLLATPPPTPFHLRPLFQDCWEIGAQATATIITCAGSISGRVALLGSMPPALFYQLRLMFEGVPDPSEPISRLLALGLPQLDNAMDDAHFAALVEDLVALVQLSGTSDERTPPVARTNLLQETVKVVTKPSVGQAISKATLPPNSSVTCEWDPAVKDLLHTLRSANFAGREPEAYLMRGIQAYRQGRFEEALELMQRVINSKPSHAHLPMRDRPLTRAADMHDAQACVVTAQQISACARIAQFMAEPSEARRLTDADLSALIPARGFLSPSLADMERIASYFIFLGDYQELLRQSQRLSNNFVSETVSPVWSLAGFLILLAPLFGKVFALFPRSLKGLGMERPPNALHLDLAKLQEIREFSMIVLNFVATLTEPRCIIDSVIRIFSSIEAYEHIYVVCGLFYSQALKNHPLQPFVFNINCYGIMSLLMANPSYLDHHSKFLDVVAKLEDKCKDSVKPPSSTHFSELLLPLATSSLPFLPKKTDVCLGLFQAYALNGVYDRALRHFWEGASLMTASFTSAADLQALYNTTNFALAITCLQKLGAPTLLAVLLQLKPGLVYQEAFAILSKAPPLLTHEAYIPYLWDAVLAEYLSEFAWRDHRRVRELLASQISKLPQNQPGVALPNNPLAQRLLIQLERDHLL